MSADSSIRTRWLRAFAIAGSCIFHLHVTGLAQSPLAQITLERDQNLRGASVAWIGFSDDSERLAVQYMTSNSTTAIGAWQVGSGKLLSHWKMTSKPQLITSGELCVFMHNNDDECLLYPCVGSFELRSIQSPLHSVISIQPDWEVVSLHHNRRTGDVTSLTRNSGKLAIYRFTDMLTGTPKRVMEFTTAYHMVSAIDFSVTQSKLAIAGGDTDAKCRSVILWDTNLKRVKSTLGDHDQTISAIGINPSAKILATGSMDGMVKIWNLDSDKLLASIRGPMYSISSFAYSKDGKYLCYTSLDRNLSANLYLIDLGRLTVISSVNADTRSLLRVAFSPNGKRIASVGSEGKVKLWDVDVLTRRNR